MYFTPSGLAPTLYGPLWNRSLFGDSLLTVTFLLRGWLTGSPTIRALFLPMSIYCLAAIPADIFNSLPPKPQPGEWFDLVWGAVSLLPVVIASHWDGGEATAPPLDARPVHLAFQQFFPLLYPALIMAALGRIAHSYPTAAGPHRNRLVQLFQLPSAGHAKPPAPGRNRPSQSQSGCRCAKKSERP